LKFWKFVMLVDDAAEEKSQRSGTMMPKPIAFVALTFRILMRFVACARPEAQLHGYNADQ
jgi:hypothetical protein